MLKMMTDVMSSNNIGVLEEKHNLSILLFLFENGTSIKSKIYQAVSTNPRMPEKLEAMAAQGLLTIKTDNFNNNRAEVTLTEKGIEVAKCLKTIDELMET